MIVTNNSSMERRAYTVREVAQMLGAGTRTVYRLIDAGELRSFRLGRAVRVRAEDVNRLVITGTSGEEGGSGAA